jgi:hypothetical protein
VERRCEVFGQCWPVSYDLDPSASPVSEVVDLIPCGRLEMCSDAMYAVCCSVKIVGCRYGDGDGIFISGIHELDGLPGAAVQSNNRKWLVALDF